MVLGFLVGTVGFLIVGEANTKTAGVEMLPTLLACSLGGAALFVVLAIAANMAIGRAIRDELELQRRGVAAGEMSAEGLRTRWK
jgi:hypothetical protein